MTERTPRRFTRAAAPRDWEHLQHGLRGVTRRLRGDASQTKAAETAGLSVGVVKNIEGENSSPTLRSLLALAHSFGLLTSEMIARAEAFDQARPLSGREAMLAVVTRSGSAPDPIAFGLAVRRRRRLLRLTQRELGERIDMHYNQIGAAERGNYVSFKTIVRLARGLRLLPSELMRLGEEEHLAAVESERAAAALERRVQQMR